MTEGRERVIEAGGRRVRVGHADKVLFPDAGITKYELADYYRRIAPTALRHCRDRAATLHRYPDGIEEAGFFQKQIGDHFPDWIDRVTLKKQDGEVCHVVANTASTLVYLADQGCITLHLALARNDRPDHPDRMIFDLDPSDRDFSKVRRTALCLKKHLDRLELYAHVQTTGSSGLHIVVPLDREAGFDTVREFAHAFCRQIAETAPDLITTEHRKKDRGGRVFLDYLRNARGQTAVAPYAVRARTGAPIATPIRWSEVNQDLDPRRYHIGNIFRRLGQIDDPWRDIARHACRLPSIDAIA